MIHRVGPAVAMLLALGTPGAIADAQSDAAARQKAHADGASAGYTLNAAGKDRNSLMNFATTQAGSLYPSDAAGVPAGTTAIFSGGKGNMGAAGNTRATNCAGFTPFVGTAQAPLTRQQQAENAECAAINTVTATYTKPGYNTTRTDPALTASRAVASNPAGFFASQGIATGGAPGTTCTPTTKTIPATFSNEICTIDIDSSLTDSYCSISHIPIGADGSTTMNDGCVPLAKRGDCGTVSGVCENSGTMSLGNVTIYLDNGSEPTLSPQDILDGKTLPPSAVAKGVTCWQSKINYQCLKLASTSTTDCDSLQGRGCTYQSSGCRDYYAGVEPPVCARQEDTYSCPTGGTKTIAVNDCTMRVGCTTNPDGSQNCIDSSYAQDGDFGATMVAMEIGREAGTYTDGISVLGGVGMNCQSKRWGVSLKCCGVSGGATRNSSFLTATMMQNAMKVGGDVLSYAWHSASAVNYDALFQQNAPSWIKEGIGAWSSSGKAVVSTVGEKVLVDASGQVVTEQATSVAANAEFGTSVGAGGFVLSYNQGVGGIAGTMGTFLENQMGGPLAPETLASLELFSPTTIATNVFGIEGLSFAFDPVSFGISMAFMVYSELTSCGQNEMQLGMARGADLCVDTGEHCSSGFLGCCKSCQRSFCCFNSKLAKLVNEQGQSQLGRSLGPNYCGGFTADELSSLDWGHIDLSSFVGDMVAQATYPDAAAIQSRAPAVVERVKSYYGK